MNLSYPFINPPLPYTYDALEPFIDQKTMELHHNRHLQTYIDNLNQLLELSPQYQNLSLEELILFSTSLPDAIRQSILNNAGGVYNHLFYFSILTPPDTSLPSDTLLQWFHDFFGSYDNFKSTFTTAALSVFGSGYAWLVIDALGNMQIITTANQNTPLPLNLCPLLNIDVWEHAYYLKHYNKRVDYISDWFHVVNWTQVEQNLRGCFNDV